MDVIYSLNKQQIEELHSLYQQEWWTKNRSIEDTKKCIRGSQINIAYVNSQGSLLGFARVLTDYIFKALIFDLIIAKEQRGTGIGKKLIETIKNHKLLQKVDHFELYCLPEVCSFYENQGFTDDLGTIRLMRYTRA